MSDKYILALDIGTSSVRAGLYDMAGNVLPATMVKHERDLTVTDDGGAEIDADEAFQQVCDAIDDVLKKCSKTKGEITHIAASSFWHSLVGIDKKGRPKTKVLGWADTRSRAQTAILRKKFNEAEVHNRTGAAFHSSFWPAKLLWLKADAPKVFAKTERWLSLSDYVMLKMTGRAVTSVSMASATGIFDQRKCTWDTKLTRSLGIRLDQLPEISKRDEEAIELSAEFTKKRPRLKVALAFPAIGDGAANNIGAGCVKRSKAALMIGTSGAMRVAYNGEPPDKIPAGLWCYRIDRQRVIIGGALSDGGGLYRWLKDRFRLADDDDITEDEIAKRKPAEHGLVFLPFLAGERSTGYHEDARGSIIGLRSATDTIDIVQAALEAVAYRFADIFDRLCTVCDIKTVIASGGALRESPIWTQIITDVIGRGMSLPDTREASSRGAVLHALQMLGAIKDLDDLKTPDGTKFKVNPRNKQAYADARAIHEDLYRRLID